MFVGITNTPRDYAWGSTTAIAQLLGREPSGEPEAELWLGAHHGSSSTILEPRAIGGYANLLDWLTAEPDVTLGVKRKINRLPFLLKILAAEQPLSLQAHPSLKQAKKGFARENEAGVPLDAPERNYKDEGHKPEVIYALSSRFEALAGFRPLALTQLLVDELVAAAEALPDESREALAQWRAALDGEPQLVLKRTVSWLLSGDDGVPPLLTAIASAAPLTAEGSAFSADFATAVELSQLHSGDPGVAVALLLNRVSLRQGEALYLPAGNIHAYLSGLGVELMASSDNVLRGGLTSKHVDANELLSVLDFRPLPAPLLPAILGENGLEIFRPDVPDFVLVKVTVDEEGDTWRKPSEASIQLTGPAIAIATAGAVTIAGERSSSVLARGESVYVTPDEGMITFTGSGTAFLATADIRQ